MPVLVLTISEVATVTDRQSGIRLSFLFTTSVQNSKNEIFSGTGRSGSYALFPLEREKLPWIRGKLDLRGPNLNNLKENL